MTIGERIKQRRKELHMSVDQVADILSKNRATVYRYESDEIENLSITVLEPLAKALNTTPAFLMGWEEETSNKPITEYENPQSNESILLNELKLHFCLLNEVGMEEALKRVKELTYIPSYCRN